VGSNNQPDVRVRLSAEGVQDVVAAFKKINAEAQAVGKGAGIATEGLSALGSQFSGLISILPELSLGAAALGFIELSKNAFEAAVNLGKLEEKTGISAKTLSVFQFAAQQAGGDADAFGKGLVKATRFFDEYDQGATSAREAVQNLFGNENALQGLNQDERIRKVTDALAKLEAGSKRTGAAVAIFGKAGAELLPVLDKLGGQGFDALAAKAEKLGVLMDDDLAKAAEQAHQGMKDLEAAAQGAATQFDAGFLPAIGDVSNALVEGLTVDGVSGFKKFGEFAGDVLKGIVALTVAVVAGVLEIGAKVSALVQNSARFTKDIFTKGYTAAKEDFINNEIADADRIDKFIQEREAKIIGALRGDRSSLTQKPKRDPEISENNQAQQDRLKLLTALAEARRKLTEAQADADIAILRANNKLASNEEKRAYDQGLVDLEKYYKDRADRINAEADKEIALIKSKAKANQDAIAFQQTRKLGKGETEAERQKRIAELQADLTKQNGEASVRELGRQSELNDNSADQRDAVRELAKARLEAEAQIYDAEGRRYDAERAQLQAQVAGLQRLKGESDAAFANRQQTLSDSGNQKIDFEQLQEKARLALQDLANARKQIQDQVEAGQISELNGEALIRDAELARLPNLQEIAAQMQAAAITPEQQQAAADYLTNVGQVKTASDQAAQARKQFTGALESGLNSGINGFFNELITGTHSVGDAFRSLASSVVSSIAQMIQQMLIQIAVQKLMKSIGFGGGGFSGGGLVGGAPGKADGGLITGPGTGTSDSIPAYLSDYEFVVKSAVVRQPGMLGFLDSLNSGGMGAVRRRGNHFAEGGLVGDMADVGGAQSGGNAGLTATLDIDPTLVLKRLETSPEWARVHIRTATDHAKKINAALGRG
jgi:hypothetical protein